MGYKDDRNVLAGYYNNLPESADGASDVHRAAWSSLIVESTAHAKTIRESLRIKIDYVEFEPYTSARAMCVDLDGDVMKVSTLNLEHPIWTPNQNLEFRIAHDVMGHWGMGAGECNPFSFVGEMAAYVRQSASLLSPAACDALFTEVVGQAAVRGATGKFPSQRIGFLGEGENG